MIDLGGIAAQVNIFLRKLKPNDLRPHREPVLKIWFLLSVSVATPENSWYNKKTLSTRTGKEAIFR